MKSKQSPRPVTNPFDLRGMWIWELPYSSGGNVPAIISRAHQYGVSTLFIKSSDGDYAWSQFSAPLVAQLHRAGLRVCAWQYVYGNDPLGEAALGAGAVRDGADCLVIDAEIEYEGKYVQAQTYISRLRALIGTGFPVALAGFPYVDFHPAFPYSVFLGPYGAYYNLPQMYWYDIGGSVDVVYLHTYEWNRPYLRPIAPLGEIYDNPPTAEVVRFRQLSRAYRAGGVSWWDWQDASQAEWNAVAQPFSNLSNYQTPWVTATIGPGYSGDLAVWAQEHLLSAGYTLPVDGVIGPSTEAAVHSFQAAHRLTTDGIIGPQTWSALLRYRPAAVHWSARGGATIASAARSPLTLRVPKSAHLKDRHDEIAGAGGAGRPSHP